MNPTAMKCARTILVTLCTMIACGAAPPRSQPYVWRNVKVVAGGFIPGIVFSRVEKGLAYLRSDMGGCYRWDASERKWIPMHDHFGESSYFGGESIAPDPIDANVVYIAAGMYRDVPSAILRSRDKGKTWEIFRVSFRMGGNEDGRGVGERLAVDPNDNRILYFGSRHDGLMRSSDCGETWHVVESFPLKGRGLPEQGKPTNGGLSFVVFDPRSGARGSPTNTIFVGSTDPGSQPRLYRSDDAGKTWQPIDGATPDLLPVKAEIDDAGVLYITYANGIGPNGVIDGAVMKLDTKTNRWTDITPDKRPDRPKGGYMGLSLDRQHPGTLAVATMNRWSPVDTVWRSTDGGETWHDICSAGSERDVSLSPFLLWGKDQSKLGWWMAALAIDPFDSDHAAYATGATVYATNDFSRVGNNEPTHWRVWADGIEQTAVITLLSPSAGAHLLSGFGDIGGFVHEDLDQSPPQGMYNHPMFGNTNTLDYAERQPNVIVRSGQPHEGEPPLAWSDDGGRTWQGMKIPSDAPVDARQERRRWRPTPAVVTSADGSTFMLMTRPPMITRDRGQTWSKSSGLPDSARPVPDRLDPARFYAIDFNAGKLYTSTDGGATFVASDATCLPDDLAGDEPTWHEAAWPLVATIGKSSDLWLVSKSGLFHSTDAGRTFAKIGGDVHVEALSFGKAPDGTDYPSLFAIGTNGNGLKAIWRSDDAGQSWIRVNDDQHQYGTRFRCIAGDPRVFGRVYVGTDGRGIVYGEPAPK
jgi:photosystem II stability/assembly factor-like uncharacterized protein